MATQEQMLRAAEISKDRFVETIDTSFDDAEVVSDKILALVDGQGDKAELPDHIMIQYLFKYNELLGQQHDEVLHDVDPYGQEADIHVQALAVNALLQEEDMAEAFGGLQTEMNNEQLTESLEDALQSRKDLSMFVAYEELDSLAAGDIAFELDDGYAR